MHHHCQIRRVHSMHHHSVHQFPFPFYVGAFYAPHPMHLANTHGAQSAPDNSWEWPSSCGSFHAPMHVGCIPCTITLCTNSHFPFPFYVGAFYAPHPMHLANTHGAQSAPYNSWERPSPQGSFHAPMHVGYVPRTGTLCANIPCTYHALSTMPNLLYEVNADSIQTACFCGNNPAEWSSQIDLWKKNITFAEICIIM